MLLDASILLSWAAVIAGVAALDAARDRPMRGWMLVGAGTLAAATFVTRPSAWIATATLLALGVGVIAVLPAWRGTTRDARGLAKDAARLLGAAVSLPILFACVAAAAGTLPTLVREISIAMPRSPALSLAEAAICVAIVVLALDGLRASRPPSPLVARLCAGALVVAIAFRVAWIASVATLPSEAFWPEAPLLVNALKLDAGEVMYGPPEELSSYTYSPLLDLMHHALLKPLHAELSIFAHRGIVVFEQLGAIAILALALRPRLRVEALLAVALAALANLLAPAIHPDHALLLCFAVAIALVVAEERMPRAVWWTLLVLVTPVATAFKLSGAGIGVGLALAFAFERRGRPIVALAGSAALTLATVPLFDATLGRFRFYAIDVQASHPMVWSRIVELPTTPAGLAAIAAIALHVWMRFGARAAASADARRVAALTACVALASLPGYVKYGGRDNNVSLLVLGAVITLLVRARDTSERSPHATLAPAAALLATLLFRPPSPPASTAERAAAIADFDRAVSAIRDADGRGEHALVLVQTTPWIAAGHRDVPHDRFHSAVELFYGRRAEAELLFAHVADGRYATIVVGAGQLRGGGDPLGDMTARLRASIEARYDRVYPAPGVALDAIDGIVVFQRRPSVHLP